ncbi:MAG: ABC transporter substrate-binding protein [Actinobacteria bacterium]|nr:ABC transporter substrate-binding protein [Actinomycetota bacterium]
MRKTTTAARTIRAVALAAIFAMLLVACGQKPGVHISSGGGGGGSGGGAGGDTTGGDSSIDLSEEGGDSTLDGSGGDSTLDGSGGGTTTGGTTGGTTTGGTTGGTNTQSGDDGGTTDGGSTSDGGDTGGTTGGTSGGGGNKPPGDDRTGAGPDKLIYGIHAPLTGAAPLPSESFREGRDLYWKWWIGTKKQKVLGRPAVEVLFRDDQYNPSSATQVCREMARSGNAFALVGGGGTDQIQACGQWSNQNQVPYFSAGVTEKGLTGLPWYFATSMSYKQQGDLLGQLVAKQFPDAKTAMIVTDTPNFDDAIAGWKAAIDKYGIENYEIYKHPKDDETWVEGKVLEYKNQGVDLIYPMTSPYTYIKFVQRASTQQYRPQYTGVGITMGLNVVAENTCDGADGAMFFSPFPGMDWARDNAPEYIETAQKEGYEADDLGFALWGLAKNLHAMWIRYGEVYGNDLTREAFREMVEQSEIKTGIFPTVRYSPQDHFGASTVHLLQTDCSQGDGVMVTKATFANGF